MLKEIKAIVSEVFMPTIKPRSESVHTKVVDGAGDENATLTISIVSAIEHLEQLRVILKTECYKLLVDKAAVLGLDSKGMVKLDREEGIYCVITNGGKHTHSTLVMTVEVDNITAREMESILKVECYKALIEILNTPVPSYPKAPRNPALKSSLVLNTNPNQEYTITRPLTE